MLFLLMEAIEALDSLAKTYYVLWLPSGTYRITATLNMTSQLGAGFFGQDPTTTIVRMRPFVAFKAPG